MHSQSSDATLSSEGHCWASPQEPRFFWENRPFPRQVPFFSASLALPWNANPLPFFWVQSRPSNGQEISPGSRPHPLYTSYSWHLALCVAVHRWATGSTEHEHAGCPDQPWENETLLGKMPKRPLDRFQELPTSTSPRGLWDGVRTEYRMTEMVREPPESNSVCCLYSSRVESAPIIRYESSCLPATP